MAGKLASLVFADSSMEVLGDNPRAALVRSALEPLWAAGNSIVAQTLGKGGKVIVPVVRGGRVQVKVDGKVVGTYALVEEQRVPFDTKYGHNTLVIKGGKAHIEDADCPDHYCEQQGEVSKTGETLVCLPHKLVAEVVAGEAADVDVVAK